MNWRPFLDCADLVLAIIIALTQIQDELRRNSFTVALSTNLILVVFGIKLISHLILLERIENIVGQVEDD